jgi:hypothetical protein
MAAEIGEKLVVFFRAGALSQIKHLDGSYKPAAT